MLATLKKAKSERFIPRMTAADKELFQMAAAIEGRTVAKFILHHTSAVARQIVANNREINLKAAKSRQFIEALLAPPRPPSPALKAAVARYRRQVTEA